MTPIHNFIFFDNFDYLLSFFNIFIFFFESTDKEVPEQKSRFILENYSKVSYVVHSSIIKGDLNNYWSLTVQPNLLALEQKTVTVTIDISCSVPGRYISEITLVNKDSTKNKKVTIEECLQIGVFRGNPVSFQLKQEGFLDPEKDQLEFEFSVKPATIDEYNRIKKIMFNKRLYNDECIE